MGKNVEFKAKTSDSIAMRARVEAFVGARGEEIHQEDTFFPVPNGRLKLRTFDQTHGELIFYQRPDTHDPKLSQYLITKVTAPKELEKILAAALGVRGVVRKHRWLYIVGRTRIHVDEVEGLGAFLESEIVLAQGESKEQGQAEAKQIMARLGIDSSTLVSEAYIDLLERVQKGMQQTRTMDD